MLVGFTFISIGLYQSVESDDFKKNKTDTILKAVARTCVDTNRPIGFKPKMSTVDVKKNDTVTPWVTCTGTPPNGSKVSTDDIVTVTNQNLVDITVSSASGILMLWDDGMRNKSQIARILKCSRAKVYKVLNKFGRI